MRRSFLEKKHDEKDFRIFLQSELVQRIQRNSRYSLRSFAKQLQVSPSSLSTIISGQRPISRKAMEKMGLALGLEPKVIQKFKYKPHGNIRKNLNESTSEIINYQQISEDVFSIISHWIHYAIIQLSLTRNFSWNTKNIAQRLGVSKVEVTDAIDRLVRVEWLKAQGSGYKYMGSPFTSDIQADLSSEAQKRFQELTLQKAAAAIREVPIQSRDHTSITFACNPKDIPKAKEYIKKFRRNLCEQMSAEQPTEVYQLNIAFYPLTKKSED